MCVTKDEGIMGGWGGGGELWSSHCAALMNSGIQRVVGGGQAQ